MLIEFIILILIVVIISIIKYRKPNIDYPHIYKNENTIEREVIVPKKFKDFELIKLQESVLQNLDWSKIKISENVAMMIEIKNNTAEIHLSGKQNINYICNFVKSMKNTSVFNITDKNHPNIFNEGFVFLEVKNKVLYVPKHIEFIYNNEQKYNSYKYNYKKLFNSTFEPI